MTLLLIVGSDFLKIVKLSVVEQPKTSVTSTVPAVHISVEIIESDSPEDQLYVNEFDVSEFAETVVYNSVSAQARILEPLKYWLFKLSYVLNVNKGDSNTPNLYVLEEISHVVPSLLVNTPFKITSWLFPKTPYDPEFKESPVTASVQ